jgi:pSer/pThr/pTyr-binding forkhead associated (FHA) protein
MATHSIVLLVRAFLTNPASLSHVCPDPVLIWEPPVVEGELIEVTDGAASEPSVDRGGSLVIDVVKGRIPNGFAFGVTLGHAENNDIVLRHGQVSRFHAYVQEANGRRSLVDANSRNGTYLEDVRLVPSKPVVLPPCANLRFGRLRVTYLEPDRLRGWLEQRIGARGPEGSPPA